VNLPKPPSFGRHVTVEEREQMIREASYLRSERRGFLPGYEESDWIIAEREVEERLAKEAGLVERGRNALDSASAIIEEELDDIKKVVTSWLENNPAIGETLSKVGIKTTTGKPTTGKPTTGKPTTKTPVAEEAPAKEEPPMTASNKEKEDPKPTVAKKATTKKAVKKKTAKAATAKTKTAKKKVVKKAAAKKAVPKKTTSKKAVKKKAVKKKAVKKST